jgi:acylphosphatase
VGFRATSCHIAQDFLVDGYVQNLPDGGVLLEAEGEAAEVERFLAAVAGRLGRFIDRTDDRLDPTPGGFDGFEIRF